MTVITQASDPTLWAQLSEQCDAYRTDWAMVSGQSYRQMQAPDGDEIFRAYTRDELLDSRSPGSSKSATYTNLDK